MKSISLSFEGEYWDYLIKYNFLFLWTYYGELEIFNWENLLVDLTEKKHPEIYRLFQGQKDIDLLLKFNIDESILKESINLSFTRAELEQYLISKYDIPTKELAISIESYREKIILNTDSGLFLMNINKMEYAEKIFEIPFYNINVGSYGKVSLSAGADGIFGFRLIDNTNESLLLDHQVKNISEIHSNSAEWVNNFIYNSSYKVDDCLLSLNDFGMDYKANVIKFFSDLEREKDISWTNNNKIYRVINDFELEEIALINDERGDVQFRSRTLHFQKWKGSIIDGAGANFGTIVECENALVVIFKNNDFENISGEAVRWKTYKDNERYSNLLGIIYDQKITFKAYDYKNNNSLIKYFYLTSK